jgi:hypothetical protein
MIVVTIESWGVRSLSSSARATLPNVIPATSAAVARLPITALEVFLLAISASPLLVLLMLM